MKKAVIYARYSSDKQTEQSIEGQLRVCTEFALKNDYEIVHIYTDRAMTGKNDQRPDFQQMLKDSSSHRFETVIVYKLDRFARNRYDSAYNKKILKNNGVGVVSATENITNTPEGILLESLLEGLAEYYSVELAQKVTRGIKESVLKGQWLGGQVPYGYDIIDKKYIINTAEAEIVKKMFEIYLKENSIQCVVDYLNQQNILNKKHKPFNYNHVRKILAKDLYIGTLRGSGLVLENKAPSIVDKKIFLKVNNMLNKNIKHYKTTDFILTGKLFCGKCGEPMTGTSGTGRSQTYFYYKCKKDKTTVSKEKIEHTVIDAVIDFLSNKSNIEHLKNNIDIYNEKQQQSEYTNSLKLRLKKIDTEISNLTNAIINGLYNEDMKIKNDNLLNEKACVIEEIEKQKEFGEVFSGALVTDFLTSLASSTQNIDKEMLVKVLVNKVIYTAERTRIYLNISPSTKNDIDKHEILDLINKTNTDCGSTETINGLP